MIDAVKDYLAPKRFGVVAYVCLIVHFLCGLTFTAVTSALRAGEIGKFSCTIDKKSSAAYKTYVEKTCYSRYEQTYNSPIPLYGFVLLSTGFTVLLSVVYSLGVSHRVENVDRTTNGQNGSVDPSTDSDSAQPRHGFHVFFFYFFHLVVRSLLGILFTVLQLTVFYPRGFDFKFSCNLPTSDVTPQTGSNTSIGKLNNTSIACENSTASEKELWGINLSVLNSVFALITLAEVISLIWRRFFVFHWRSDTHFIIDYLLRKRYERDIRQPVSIDIPLLCSSKENNCPENDTPDNNTMVSSIRDSNIPDSTANNIGYRNSNIPESATNNIEYSNIANNSFHDLINFSKQQRLSKSRSTDICYAPKIDLNDMYIDVIIHTGRAAHEFGKKMERHEMFDVYMQVPNDSTRLEKIKDLFYPNEDTKGYIPRTILAVGRPGIGKTVLTEKILRDWANGIDRLYSGKIAFFFKFRWFNFEELKKISLKKFLQYGTGLSEESFEGIFEEILKKPQKAIFIFDGLDEFNGNLENCLELSRMLPNDMNTCTSAMTLFIKLAYGNMLPGATVLVTSRPTAENFYSKLHFDRNVEILGFTSDKIKEYVIRFCENIERSDLQPKIWEHVMSSPDLLNLCYIPVNCFIICVTLSGYLSDPKNDTSALPTTLTELYNTAVCHITEKHSRNSGEISSEQTVKTFQQLGFDGIKNGQLVFNKECFSEQMKKSGLVNSLSNPIFPVQTQYCFIHLTIQEFLAARHVTETLSPEEIEKFISTHIESGKWHLVLQFIAGLLGEKMKMSGSDYHHCVLAFPKGLTLRNGEMRLDDYANLLVMKCLNEVDDEEIVKNVCNNTDLNTVTKIDDGIPVLDRSAIDCAAVISVCKHLKNVRQLELHDSIKAENGSSLQEVGNLLQQSCLTSLKLIKYGPPVSELTARQLTSALMKSKCTLNHEHRKLMHLTIRLGNKTDECVLINICTFLTNGHARHLNFLELSAGLTSSGIYQLSAVLASCRKLTSLDLSDNPIGDEGVRTLCNVLKQGQIHKLNTLSLVRSSLTKECMPYVCELLCDEHFKLNELQLSNNDIGNKGLRALCTSALSKEQCILTKLDVDDCSLTDDCVQCLCETLKDGNCKLINLGITRNKFTEQGKASLRNVNRTECCEARGLKIRV